MNTLFFVKYCIVDGLKVFFPRVELGVPEEKVENLQKVPVNYACKGLCLQCKIMKEINR